MWTSGLVQQRVMGMRDGAASAIYKGLQRLYAYSKRIKTESKNTPFHSYRFSKLRATSLPLPGSHIGSVSCSSPW